MASVKRILIAIDFSQGSYDALEKAVELASQSAADLYLLHVVSKTQWLDEYRGAACSLVEHIEARMIVDSYMKLSAVVDQRIPKTVKSHLAIRLGDVAGEIVRNAEKERADMIILGAQERKGWKRFIFTSVADRVTPRAGCPVVTFKQHIH